VIPVNAEFNPRGFRAVGNFERFYNVYPGISGIQLLIERGKFVATNTTVSPA